MKLSEVHSGVRTICSDNLGLVASSNYFLGLFA
jgi:hypothetical protein